MISSIKNHCWSIIGGGILLCAAANVIAQSQSDCSAVLPAMKLVTTVDITRSALLSIADFIESSKEQTYNDLMSSNNSFMGQYLDVFKGDFNSQNATTNFRAWKEEVVRSLRIQSATAASFSTRYETMAKDVVQAWSACIAAAGLHVWIEINEDDPKQFTVNVKYLSTDPARPFITFTPEINIFSPASTTTCNKLVGYGGSGARKYQLGGTNAYQTACIRSDPSQSPMITVNTQLGGQPRPVPIRRPCTETANTETHACAYPKTDGFIISEVKTCIGNKPGQPSSRVIADTCRDVGCRNPSDIVHTLAAALWGSAATQADMDNWVPKLNHRLPMPQLIIEMAADRRFFDHVLPPSLFLGGPYLSPSGHSADQPTVQRLATNVLQALGYPVNWDQMLDITRRPELFDPALAAKGVRVWVFNQDSINRLVKLMLSQDNYLSLYGREQIPPSIIDNRVIKLCPETRTQLRLVVPTQ